MQSGHHRVLQFRHYDLHCVHVFLLHVTHLPTTWARLPQLGQNSGSEHCLRVTPGKVGAILALGLGLLSPNTSNTISQRIRAGRPSNRVQASSAITSASVEECETAPCFLQTQVRGTNVRGPTNTRYAPDVDFESSMSPAKLASEKSTNLQSRGWTPTQLTWTLFPLWCR